MHKIKNSILSVFAIVFIQLIGHAQTEHSFFNNYNDFTAADSNKLFLRIENFNFIKNNEYKGTFADGATLLGYLLSPKLAYYPSNNIRIKAGIRMQKYSGITKYSEAEPLFTVH